MKSILIIGLGRFGRHLCRKFMSLDNEVMIVDRDEAAVSALADEVTSAQIADCTDENALRALGVKNKEMGAARVVAKAARDVHAKLLLRNGADEVVYPERDSAERLATRLSARNVFDYIELTDEYSIYEIPPLDSWVGRSVRDVDVRNKYHINILAVKEDGALKPLPGGDYRFTGREHLLAMAAREDAKKLLRKI